MYVPCDFPESYGHIIQALFSSLTSLATTSAPCSGVAAGFDGPRCQKQLKNRLAIFF
jgi:hypothetical protein